MTSKNSYWKLSKMNMSRRIPYLVLCFMFCFVLLPIVTYFKCNMYIRNELYESGYVLRYVAEIIASGGITQEILVGVLAVVFGITGNSWNNSQKKNDFYKSLPVRENTRFLYIHVNSLICFLICFGINVILSNLVVAVFGLYNSQFLLATVYSLVVHILEFIAIYWIVVIAQYLTGNIVLAICGTAVLLFDEVLIRVLMYAFKTTCYKTFYNQYNSMGDILCRNITCPIASSLTAYRGVDGKYLSFYGASNYAGAMQGVGRLLVQCIIYMLIAFYIYNRRPAQGGNKNLVFDKTKPFFKGIIMIPVVLVCVWTFISNDGGNIVSGIFGLVLGMVISHILLQFLIEGDFKAIKKGLMSTALAGIIVAGVCMFYALNSERYDTYVPDASKVDSVSILAGGEYRYDFYELDEYNSTISSAEYFISEVNESDEGFVKEVLDIIKADIDSKMYCYDSSWAGDDDRVSLMISYNLKNGDRKLRSYLLPIEDVMKIKLELYDQPEYIQATNQLEYPNNRKLIEEAEKLKVEYYNYGFSDYDMCAMEDKTMQNEMLEALTKDHSQRTGEIYKNELPVGYVIVESNSKNMRGFYLDMPVYAKDVNTMAVLKKAGYEAHEFDSSEITGIEVTKYSENDSASKTVRLAPGDKGWEDVVNNCVLGESYYSSPVGQMYLDSLYEVKAYDENGVFEIMILLPSADKSIIDSLWE